MHDDTVTTAFIYSLLQSHPDITTDSRSVTPGSMFFALRGDQFNGNLFAAKALESGASYAVVDDPETGLDQRYLRVTNVLETLQEMAQMHRKALNAKVIGITGSNGKTTTKELVHAVLSSKFRTVATQGNLNNHIGVPLTILRTPPDTEVLIVEMGANHVGEIKALCEIADPEYGIITNIGRAHLEGFGSIEGVIRAKGELYDYLSLQKESLIFLNAEDPLLCSMANDRSLSQYTYGSNRADIRGSIASDQMQLILKWDQDENTCEIRTKLAGGYNLPNVLAAIAVGSFFGVSDQQIREALEGYTPANNRSQMIETKKNRLIADCYNANPSSMKEAIEAFGSIHTTKGMLILGDMLELGDYAEEEHLNIARMALETNSQCVFVGDHFFRLQNEIQGIFFKTADQLVSWVKNAAPEGYRILVKGSRGIRLELVLPYL